MRTLQLTQIEFSNASKKVRCQGKMKEEHLQFDSNLIIDFSQLNYLMNQLTKSLVLILFMTRLSQPKNRKENYLP